MPLSRPGHGALSVVGARLPEGRFSGGFPVAGFWAAGGEEWAVAGTGGGRPSVFPTLLYADAKAAIRQLTEAFGFTELLVYEGEDGSVVHAELVQGNGAVMLGSRGRGGVFDTAMKGAGPAGVYVVVDDVDAHHRRAVAQGAEILAPPADQDYGSR